MDSSGNYERTRNQGQSNGLRQVSGPKDLVLVKVGLRAGLALTFTLHGAPLYSFLSLRRDFLFIISLAGAARKQNRLAAGKRKVA